MNRTASAVKMFFCLSIFLGALITLSPSLLADEDNFKQWEKDFLPIFQNQDYKQLRKRIHNPNALDLDKLEKSLKENLDRGLEKIGVHATRLNEYENLKGTINDVLIDTKDTARRLQRYPLRIVADLFVVPSNSLPDPNGMFVFRLGLVEGKPVIVFPEDSDPVREFLTGLRDWTMIDGSKFSGRLVRLLADEGVVVFLKSNFKFIEVSYLQLTPDDKEIVDSLTKID